MYTEIIHRSQVEPGFAAALFSLTDAGRTYLERVPLSGPALYDLLCLLRLSVLGAAAAQQSAKPPSPPDPPEPDTPESLERKAYLAKAQFERDKEQFEQAKKSIKDTMDVAADMKSALRSTIAQIDRAFQYTMWMYIVSFFMGVALILAAIVSAFTGYGGHTQLLSMVLGGLGTATTLAFFFTKPPESLQSSRASLAQLQCALLAWFNDFFNQNSMIVSIAAKQDFDKAAVQEVSRDILTHTDDILKMLQQYCKLIENPTDVSNASMLDSVKKVIASDKSGGLDPGTRP